MFWICKDLKNVPVKEKFKQNKRNRSVSAKNAPCNFTSKKSQNFMKFCAVAVQIMLSKLSWKWQYFIYMLFYFV